MNETNTPIQQDFHYADLPQALIHSHVQETTHRQSTAKGSAFGAILGLLLIVLAFFNAEGGHGMAQLIWEIMIGIGIAFCLLLLLLPSVRKRRQVARDTMAQAPCRAGLTKTTLTADGLQMIGNGMIFSLTWPMSIAVDSLADTTLLKPSLIELIPLPHAFLPPGLTPVALQTQIATWRAAAA